MLRRNSNIAYTVAMLWMGLIIQLTSVNANAGASIPFEQFEFLDEQCESMFSIRATLTRQNDADGMAVIVFNWSSSKSGYCLTIRRRKVRLSSFHKGKWKQLKSSVIPSRFEHEGKLLIIIHRREKFLSVIVGDTIVIVSTHPGPSGGRVGHWATGGYKWVAVRYQPAEPIRMSDDFMRLPDEPSPWEVVKGTWNLQTARGEPRVPPARLIANPFTYRGISDKGVALTVTGYWFWVNYAVAASVKPEGKGSIGLCVYYRSPNDYILFRWTHGLATGKRELVLVRNGKEEILAQSDGGYERGQWYWL
ncbi:MAG TPA: hypothetical protein EYP10_03420, partial [Armatimonadetes bacterium]|nr:hypothetical protein [Armatimonadota bacterium]